MSVARLAITWQRAAASRAVRAVAVNRPDDPPQTSVLDWGLVTPFAQIVKFPEPVAAFTSRHVITAAVAPAGTPLESTLRSRVRATPGLSLVLEPTAGLVPGRES